MRRTLLLAVLVPGPALADPVTVKPLVDTRIRYEHADQDGTTADADAATVRMRAGVEAKSGPFAVLVESEATLALASDFNDGLSGRPGPVVGDPQNIELNRVQVQFNGLAKTIVTVGRQRINLDDQRFVGNAGWRQNEQTSDAVRFEWTGVPKLRADVTYSWSNRTIWGIDGAGARPQAIGGDSVFATLGYATPRFGVTGFAYLVDLDEAAVQSFRLSSQTFGIRATATFPAGRAKLGLLASYAHQSDWHNNPNAYSADYLLGEGWVEVSGYKLTVGYEELGADTGAALTSFQTPFATLHKFNGWADKFLVTPPNGLRDTYIGAGYAKGPLSGQVVWHSFTSDRLGLDYGREWNAQLAYRASPRIVLTAKYADYTRDGAADFAGDADTSKFWLQLEYRM